MMHVFWGLLWVLIAALGWGGVIRSEAALWRAVARARRRKEAAVLPGTRKRFKRLRLFLSFAVGSAIYFALVSFLRFDLSAVGILVGGFALGSIAAWVSHAHTSEHAKYIEFEAE